MIHISRSGATLGVFDETRVREGLTTGEFIGTDLGWTEGMPTWRPLSELESFHTPAAPPPPSAPPLASAASSVAPAELVVSNALAGQERTGLPWENRASIGFINALFETIVMVLTKPNEAFGIMKRHGGLGDPVLFMLIMGSAGAVISFFFSMIMQGIGFGAGGNTGLGALLGAGVGSVFVLLMTPIMVVLFLFLGAGIAHVCLMIVGGANQPFETTLRVLSYGSGSANVFQLVPFCGGMIAAIYSIVVNCIGLARAHETDTWRALVAILLPVVVCCGGFAFLFVVIIGGAAGLAEWR